MLKWSKSVKFIAKNIFSSLKNIFRRSTWNPKPFTWHFSILNKGQSTFDFLIGHFRVPFASVSKRVQWMGSWSRGTSSQPRLYLNAAQSRNYSKSDQSLAFTLRSQVKCVNYTQGIFYTGKEPDQPNKSDKATQDKGKSAESTVLIAAGVGSLVMIIIIIALAVVIYRMRR